MTSIIRNKIRDEERIRCFLFKNTTNGYLLLQSEGPSCQGYDLKKKFDLTKFNLAYSFEFYSLLI